MDVMEIITGIWSAINSPLGISIVAIASGGVLGKLFLTKPMWQAFEGTIIAGIKYAEKSIPDSTKNRAAKRLDEALKYVLAVHREITRRGAKPAEVVNLREGIQIKHAELEVDGNLK